jgi:hypothetical protein
MPKHRTPSYRLRKPSGLGVVRLSGQGHYLGRHGTPQGRAEYDRLVGESLLPCRGSRRQSLSAEAEAPIGQP